MENKRNKSSKILEPDRFIDFKINVDQKGYRVEMARSYGDVFIKELGRNAALAKIKKLGVHEDDELIPRRICRNGGGFKSGPFTKVDQSAFLRFRDLNTDNPEEVRRFANKFGYLAVNHDAAHEDVDDWAVNVAKMRNIISLRDRGKLEAAVAAVNLELPGEGFGAYVTQPDNTLRFFPRTLRGMLFTQVALWLGSAQSFDRCERCGAQYIPKRRGGRFCSDSCRQQKWLSNKDSRSQTGRAAPTIGENNG